MSRKQKIMSFLVLPAALVLLIVLGGFYSMSQEDARHARFYNTGKTVNDFLKSYCQHLEEAHAAGDAGRLGELLSSAYSSPGRGAWVWGEPRAEGEITLSDLDRDGAADYGRGEHLAEAASYLDGIARIDQTICKINMIEDVEFERAVDLTVKFILDGVDREGGTFQDRMFYRWHLTNEAGAEEAYAWRIAEDELIEGIRVNGDGRGFVAVENAELGIDFVHQRDPKLHMKKHQADLQFGVVQHASGGISAADYDGDGKNDLLFLGGVECRLYRNDGVVEETGVPRFTDVTAEAGLLGIDQAHTAVFADFDNDGDRDLFVGRYLVESRYYENQGDAVDGRVTFVDATAEMGLDLVAPVTSSTLLDYDKDGYLDVYLAVNGNAFEAFPRLPFFAQNGQPNRLLKNDGGRGFVDVTAESGTGDVGWSLAVAAGDYDGDGLPDIAVANDFGRKNLYKNNGDGTFSEIAKDAGVLDFSGGMGVALGDFDDDGLMDVYMSNINSNQRWFGEDMTVSQYTRNVVRSKWFVADFFEYKKLYDLIGSDWTELGTQIGEGNSLFKNRGDGTFEELKDSHTARAGWGWSVAFLDYDNDSDQDLYAANGWISNTPGTDL